MFLWLIFTFLSPSFTTKRNTVIPRHHAGGDLGIAREANLLVVHSRDIKSLDLEGITDNGSSNYLPAVCGGHIAWLRGWSTEPNICMIEAKTFNHA